MTTPRSATRLEARRFLRRALLLDEPAADVGTVVTHLGFIQIDPINVCGRMHDLILRNRVLGYQEGGLMRFLHGEDAPLASATRPAFEHHLPSTRNLSALPLEAWPHLQASMRARSRTTGAWSGRLTPREKELAARILERLAATPGAMAPEEMADGRRSKRGWGTATLAKATMQKLYFHGRLQIVSRQQNRRLYELPERVLPAEIFARPAPTPAETERWLAQVRLRQHRLTTLSKVHRAAADDLVEPIAVEGCPPLWALKSDAALWEGAGQPGPETQETLLLAPLDPIIYHRPLTRALWDFDYNWEVYVPAPKRKRGYYALPVLAGLELVGHVDPKADREKKRLRVMTRSLKRGFKASKPLGKLAEFLGLKPG